MTNADTVREHSFPLKTLDPLAPLDDLEPLLDLVGQARVVAIGENNHHVREFCLLRHRILRLLVERAGFTVYGFESGFTEGQIVDAWVQGGPGEVADIASAGTGFTLGEAIEVHDALRWMRERGEDGHAPVGFAGLDVPGSAGSPAAALRAITDYLREIDPGALGLVDDAEEATSRYAGASSAVAMTRYAELDAAARDAATAALSRLLAHVESLRPVYLSRGGRTGYARLMHHIRGAWRLDQYLRELGAMTTGKTLLGENSSRDVYMADTVRHLLDEGGPGTRVVAAVHNGHLQRSPFTLGDTTPILPMGHQLACDLGDDYVAVAMTCGTGTTTGLSPDPAQPLGFALHEVPLPEAEPESVEALLSDLGLAAVDLRGAAAAGAGPQRIRHADTYVQAPVVEAFDAIVHVPVVHPTSYITGHR